MEELQKRVQDKFAGKEYSDIVDGLAKQRIEIEYILNEDILKN